VLTPDHSFECSRARDAASARLDAPLPELDDARLDAHLDGCEDCRTFAAEAAALAALLRAAPLEEPGRPLFVPASAPMPAPVGARRRPVVRVQAVAAAVVLLAAAIGSSFALGRAIGGHSSVFSTVTAIPADVLSLRADSTQQHLLAMISRLQPVGTLDTGTAIAL
jgi:predicted anti-sigma-YlaC factor YlaD